jgi:phosphoribosyl-ATP pyrophosphohydrolase
MKLYTVSSRRKSDPHGDSGSGARDELVRAVDCEINGAEGDATERQECEDDQARWDQSILTVTIGSIEIEILHRSLDNVTPESNPRTARLLGSSTRKSAQKVIEEAGEVALEAAKHHARGVVRESADLLYHLVVLWRRSGVMPDDVWNEMHRRAEALGIAEKLPKSRNRDPGTLSSHP